MISEKIANKRSAILYISTMLGIHVDDLPYAYPDEVFTSRLTRKLATQALNMNIDDFHASRLDSICNIPFNRDNRTPVEYAVDLIYGWLVEDMIYEYLLQNKFDVKKQGIDKDREFLSSGKIKSDVDFVVNGKQFDVYFDAQGYWKKTNKIDIRESKWRELEKNDAGIICVSTNGFAIVDSSSDYTLGPNSAWGGKTCATVKGIRDLLKPADELVKELKRSI